MILVLLSFFLDIRVYIMRLCECAFMRIRVHTYTRLCVYACIRLRVYAYTRVCIYAFKRIYRRVAVDNGVEELERALGLVGSASCATFVCQNPQTPYVRVERVAVCVCVCVCECECVCVCV